MKKNVYIIALVLVIIDQIIKNIIINLINVGDGIKLLPNLLHITHINNEGAAWGILKGKVLLLIIISVMVIFYIVRLIKNINQLMLRDAIIYGLLLGGIIGNLIDRVIYGHVIDFIDIYIYNYNFPVFNISDMAIVIGTMLIIYDILIKGDIKNEDVNS